jgi:Mg-chelatase subunit ChlD
MTVRTRQQTEEAAAAANDGGITDEMMNDAFDEVDADAGAGADANPATATGAAPTGQTGQTVKAEQNSDGDEDSERGKRTKRKEVGFAEKGPLRVDLDLSTFAAVDTEQESGKFSYRAEFITQLLDPAFATAHGTRFNLVFCVDFSGSMFWHNGYEAVKAFFKNLVPHIQGHAAMNGGTLFGVPMIDIVGFGTKAQLMTTEPIDPTAPDAADKLDAVCQSFFNMGGTNIEAGLRVAVDKLDEYDCKDPKSGRTGAIILLTDGESGAGARTPEEFSVKVGEMLEDRHYWIGAAALGNEVNPNVCKAIVDAGHGEYAYAMHPGQLENTFTAVLNVLLDSPGPFIVESTSVGGAEGGEAEVKRYGFGLMHPDKPLAPAMRVDFPVRTAGRKPAASFTLRICEGDTIKEHTVTVAVKFAPASEVPKRADQTPEVFKRAQARQDIKAKFQARVSQLSKESNGDVAKIAAGVQKFKMEQEADGAHAVDLRGVDAAYRSLSAAAETMATPAPAPAPAAPVNVSATGDDDDDDDDGDEPCYRSCSANEGACSSQPVYRSAGSARGAGSGPVPGPVRTSTVADTDLLVGSISSQIAW